MNSSTTIQAPSTTANEHHSEKLGWNERNSQLSMPPQVVVRARSINEGIEMRVLARGGSVGDPTLLEDDDHSTSESETSSRKEWIVVIVCGLCLFLSGWQDGSLGPLIPTIQNYYGLTFTSVSVLFISGCAGFLLAAGLNIYLSDRLGFGGLILLGGVFQTVAYAVLVPALPFPVMSVAFVVKGFGIGLQDALANGLVAALRKNPSEKLGIIHAFYGAGAFISPVVATQFTYHPRWSYQYIVPLTIASFNLVFLYSTFGFHTQEELLGQVQLDDSIESGSKERKYKQVFGSPAVHLMAIFCLFYVGAETTLGGWIVTFVVEERGGGMSAGYTSSGFYGGLMLGRIGLIWLNQKIGERRVVYGYLLLAIGLQVTIWMLPNLLGNAIAFALVGVLMGPLYPISMNVLGTVVPKWLLIGAMGWVGSVGQAGGALFPFLTGMLIEKHGVHILQPILVALLGGMAVSWAVIPLSTKGRGD